MMGEGFAILPLSNEISAPISGTITLVSDSKHAIGLETEDGLEILVHMGLI